VKRGKWLGRLKLAALPLAFLLSAATAYQVNHGAAQDITEHSECRNVANNHASGKAIFIPTKTSGEWASLYNGPPPHVTVTACAVACTVTPGSQSFTTAGNHTFAVPCHNTLTVEVWGAGGGGAGCNGTKKVAGADGGTSDWDGTVLANGGNGASSSSGGAGGTASGGTTNITGSDSTSSKGGNGANGGAGGAARTSNGNGNPGSAPGGGGGAARNTPIMGGGGCSSPGGGGGGGYASISYVSGTYTVSSSVPIAVGGGGAGGNTTAKGGNGAVGRVTVTWN